jgi:UDP-GlcNAc3NAcA epimerase
VRRLPVGVRARQRRAASGMKVLTVVGARPQIIKAAAVSGPLRRRVREVLVHTGQHYDDGMSDQFFRELDVPAPDYHLGIGSGSHGEQTGRMLAAIEPVIVSERPDCALVYGDTNSTLAGALAAAKLCVPVVHVEAGLRSYNRAMPEETNRIVADHVASLLCCPGDRAARNLAAEGITRGVHVTGDVMRDLVERARPRLDDEVLLARGLTRGAYGLLTLHRAHNTDHPDRLARILGVLADLPMPIVFPVHPRTRHALAAEVAVPGGSLRMIEPVGYADMLTLQRSARVVLTDSGGVQKEAYWLGVPCVTLREETEWTETVDAGWNRLVGSDPRAIRAAIADARRPDAHPNLYGDGCAGERIAALVAAS